MSACECSPCGRRFTGLTTFDKHQDVDYDRPHADVVRCLDPATLGMQQNRFGLWGFPMDADSRARVSQMRAERAAGVVPLGVGVSGVPRDADGGAA